jgi:hypothetical protein
MSTYEGTKNKARSQSEVNIKTTKFLQGSGKKFCKKFL